MEDHNRTRLSTILWTTLLLGLFIFNGRTAGAAPSSSLDIKSLDASEVRITGVKSLDSDGTYPRWSPDGKRLLYTVFPGSDSQAMYLKYKSLAQIWVMDASGGNKKLVVTDGAYGAWSPDGKRIVYRSFRDRTYGIGIYDFASKKDIRFKVSLASNIANEMYPYWSKDMKEIIFLYNGTFGIPTSILAAAIDLDNLELKKIRKPASKVSAGQAPPSLPDNIEEKIITRNKAHPTFMVAEAKPSAYETHIHTIPAGPPYGLSDAFGVKKGIWAISKDGMFYNFLTEGCTPELAPDLREMVFSRFRFGGMSEGIFIGHLYRLPFKKSYGLELGSEDGIIPGDVFAIYEKKINPLNNKTIGYHPKKIKGSGFVDSTENTSSILIVNIRASAIQAGDVAAFPGSKIWTVLKKAGEIETRDMRIRPIAGTRYSPHAIMKIRELKENPQAIEVLTSGLNSSTESIMLTATEALGRIGDKKAGEALVRRLREKLRRGARDEVKERMLWALRQIGTVLSVKCKDGTTKISVRDIVAIQRTGNFPPFKLFKVYLKDDKILECSF